MSEQVQHFRVTDINIKIHAKVDGPLVLSSCLNWPKIFALHENCCSSVTKLSQ